VTDTGIEGDSGGILVIDDDLNPGLRGTDINSALRSTAGEFVPGSSAPATTTNFTQWSSSQIGSRLGNQAQARASDFPALAKPPAPAGQRAPSSSSNNNNSSNDNDDNKTKKKLPKSSTLANIAGSVKKTDPEERQRMWEAHERFLQKARMSNLTFGGEAPPATTVSDVPPIATISLTTNDGGGSAQPSEGQLERNRALAEALGVQPATTRNNNPNIMSKTGWARPSIGEYGNELNSIVYPEELILQARERLGLLAKLEKRWALFLEDDKASSMPLWPMDRPTRAFVHEYSDFWKLNTESFDSEPKRYIHCVKLLDTRAPSPLLSQASRNWTAPKSAATLNLAELPRHSGAATATAAAAAATPADSSRWDHLDPTPTRERPKLELKERTLPLELPPAPAPSSDFFSEEERRARQEKMQERARREREKVEAQKRALEAAFASDSEDDDEDNVGGDDDASDDSDWTTEQQEVQDFSDEEGM